MESRQSEQLFKEALEVMPGGVSSPVRAFKSVGGTPVTFKRGERAYLEDWDGNRFLDFCCSWGPLVLGHAHPYVRECIEKVLVDLMAEAHRLSLMDQSEAEGVVREIRSRYLVQVAEMQSYAKFRKLKSTVFQ